MGICINQLPLLVAELQTEFTSKVPHVDFGNLRTRLSQNGVQEKLTAQWIDRCLRQLGCREDAVALSPR